MDFLAPVKFFRDEPRTVTIAARVEPDTASSDLLVRCTLTAERALPGQATPTRTTHFTGTVRLSATPAEPEAEKVKTKVDGTPLSNADVYAFYFHGPAYQVVGEAWRKGDGSMTRMASPLPDNHTPGDQPTVIHPRLSELCFQTAGLWEAGTAHRMALPTRVERMRVLADPAGVDGPLYCLARPAGESRFDCAVVDGKGNVVVRMDGYESIVLPAPIPEQVLGALDATFGSTG